MVWEREGSNRPRLFFLAKNGEPWQLGGKVHNALKKTQVVKQQRSRRGGTGRTGSLKAGHLRHSNNCEKSKKRQKEKGEVTPLKSRDGIRANRGGVKGFVTE